MSVDGQDKVKTSRPEPKRRGKIAFLLVALGVLTAAGWTARYTFPSVTFLLWGAGETVLPLWDKIDPTAPRLPRLSDDTAGLKDAPSKGRALRTAVDKFYISLPETTKSWLAEILAPPYMGPGIDIGELVEHYVPAGTTFDEAENILRAAGMTIVWPRITQSERTSSIVGKPLRDYDVKASLEQRVSGPLGYMRFYVWMRPQIPGDYGDGSPIGKVTASLNKEIGAPTPPVSFPFDASKASAAIDTTIRIVKERYYQFDLVFRGSRPADMPAVGKLVGETYLGDAFLDRRYKSPEPGIVVPIHVVVTNDRQQIVYDRTIDTQGHYAFSYLEISRTAGGAKLTSGLYRIRVNTTKDIPELSNSKIEFSVTYDARL